ncbi:chorion class B protein Ld10-like [Achroia grisella]|uniref:chorion class B protein Ld10-like n=1 Tax=Achroia grisella TaxID=688607 RepID=UPI0027D30FD5|nr:chorion class B protein Ld10-like [Achroia grisella]
MATKFVLVLCAQALLIQCAVSQISYNPLRPVYSGIPSLGAISGSSIVENTVVENSVAIGNSGWGLANNGLIGSGLGLANAGVVSSGLGLANTGIIGSGLGLANTGVISSGLANSAVIGNTLLPAPSAAFLDITSFSTGDVLPINSFSPIAPAGITVLSQNTIEGPLAVVGQLPFLSAVAFEGALPSEGAGAAGCGCGTAGNIGIIKETFAPIPAPALGGIGIGAAGLGLGGARLF